MNPAQPETVFHRAPSPCTASDLRVIYRIDRDAIVILEIFSKETPSTPKSVIEDCRKRLKHYDEHLR